jgi:acetyltransferase-like isoleucine patch superfamily enzyme
MTDAPAGADAFHAHETAIVEPGARIGAGTHIWHHAHVRTGAVIGRDCNIGKNVYVDAGAVIGDRVKVQNNVSVYLGITIEDGVFVGPSAVFTNDLFPRAGSDHWEVATTVVRRGASIGANATIVCGIELGAYSLVGAGSVVTRSVEANEMVAGNPAGRIGWVCDCGRRASHDRDRPAEVRCTECAGRVR